MSNSRTEIASLLSSKGGLISRQERPELATALDWLKRRGDLVALLPGVYCSPSLADDTLTRIRAIQLWCPDAVLTGRAAAAVSFWPKLKVGTISCAARRRPATAPGYRLSQRKIPAELIENRRGLRYTSPALTALDLCDSLGGDAVDTVLRTRAATLAQLHTALALTAARHGNLRRRQLLLDSRDQPWSAAERLGHRLLRAAGITGWSANLGVPSLASVYYIDVAFEEQMLAIEIDGRLHEDDPSIFESDRWRQNHLALQGWLVLRYTWRMLQEHPEVFIQDVRTAIALKSAFQPKR